MMGDGVSRLCLKNGFRGEDKLSPPARQMVRMFIERIMQKIHFIIERAKELKKYQIEKTKIYSGVKNITTFALTFTPTSKNKMAKQTYHIEIPRLVKDYLKLIVDIDAENDEQSAGGGHSLLHDETENIKQAVKDMTQADKLEDQALAKEKEVEKLREQRDQLWKKTSLPNERGWRKTLEGKLIKKIHVMGDWGYEINTSPRAKKSNKTT